MKEASNRDERSRPPVGAKGEDLPRVQPEAKGASRARVALAGQPNAGKTSIFNALTGAHQRVGNYPGVTVERREGVYRHGDQSYEVTDLPGTYSLSSFSPEERIAQQELLEDRPDVVVVVVDSTTLKRSLVFVAQMMQLGVNPVLCLNMADEARAAGQQLDLRQMELLLGFRVVETVGHRREGLEELREAIAAAMRRPTEAPARRLVLGQRLGEALAAIREPLAQTTTPPESLDWVATRLLVADPWFEKRVSERGESGARALEEAARQRRRLEQVTGEDVHLFVTERYYGFVDGLLRETLRSPSRADAREVSDRIDRVLAHRIWGLPVFMAVMYGIFWLTFSLGEIPMGWLESGFAALGAWVSGLWPAGSDSALRSLVVDGLIGGVGGVLVFLPNIVLLFFGLALLEDTGYMARAAFLVDRLMHRFGLHGKSFLPMISGFGCSIPGIMATRTLENERDRLTTMLVLPLMSCGARLPIWMLLIPAFFAPPWRAPMLWLIYVTGIALALLLALLLRRSVLRGDETPFVMELPPYRLPTGFALLGKMADRSWLYVRKAGTVILAISLLLWFATSYPKPDRYAVDQAVRSGSTVIVKVDGRRGESDAARAKRLARAVADARGRAPATVTVLTEAEARNQRATEGLRYSLAGRVGAALSHVLAPLGFDWKLSTGLVGAFAAKEVFVAQMGIVYSLGEVDEGSKDLRGALAREYSPLVGLSLMLFLLIATPCMATLAVTRRESGSWKWALFQFLGLTLVAYVVALLVFQVGRLFL
jgi:ferrous iron transport protein B